MLTAEQYSIIRNQLSKENASEFVKALIGKYANTVENAGELLSYIPKLAEKQIRIKEKRIEQYSWGVDLMIGDRYTHPGKYKKGDSHNKFCMLFYMCKAHFVNGNVEHDSIAGKAFFNEFVKMLKEKTEFDYTSRKDWEWIYTTAGGADWLESVIKQNIDCEFVKPKNTKITYGTCKNIW